ncbi:MAG: phenylalanine--tRNA ligase subunit beta [Thiotrichaceae bacterium]
MKLSENWLHSWVNYTLPPVELVNQLTMIGLEVEGLSPVAAEFTHVIIGEVRSVQPLPDTEKLKLCQVHINQSVSLNVVCGAPNVAVGQKVAVATPGAKLPDDIKIIETLVRGVKSQGMICSEAELGLSERGEGIMVLEHSAPIGMNLRDYLQLEDLSLEVNVTPNRGDCLSIMGLAREVGVMVRQSVQAVDCQAIHATIPDVFPVTVHIPAACPRYVGRVLRNINPHAQTPTWMRERLRRSGNRCIHPVVDVTNYVLLELGQPMHAFDLAKLNSGIQVRMAVEGETSGTAGRTDGNFGCTNVSHCRSTTFTSDCRA